MKAAEQRIDTVRQPGLTQEELMEAYAKRQLSDFPYDKHTIEAGYNAPRTTAERMASMVAIEDRAGYKILDVGAGTGLVGVELNKLGFQNLHALEPSDVLTREAEVKNVYIMSYNCFMEETATPGLYNDQFDGLTTAGCFMENHLPVGSLDEMIRIVKPGGVIIIQTRLKYLTTVESYRDKLEPRMRELETRGQWKMTSREVLKNYFADDEGIMWAFVVC